MKAGEMVRLRAYGGEEIVRYVLEVKGKIVIVCRQEEYEKARREGRIPVGVGFRLNDVIMDSISVT